MRNPQREKLMKPGEVGIVFDVKPGTVVDWAKDGRIRSVRTPGGQWRFRPADVEALLAAGRTEQTDTPEDVEPTARPVLVGPDSEVQS